MLHVDNKAELFIEIHRVLRPGAEFGIHDVMCLSETPITYPVPWADGEATSLLDTPPQVIPGWR